MQSYHCRSCGYDMTGTERLSNSTETIGFVPYTGFDQEVFPMSLMATSENTITCPNCGQVGHWV
ncbi:MAG: hypothetical protein ATN33_03635 [Epulopiscium sp. Nele67-Bin001]|nr:MAG: hypothetical protein BEN18_06370 [Epulopiscium sp. Nuni2H_MBin001]OON90217.1 MAG: hypothetical protein ATN33_03635 [Epulopiscium sp. Nele67-Bin001]